MKRKKPSERQGVARNTRRDGANSKQDVTKRRREYLAKSEGDGTAPCNTGETGVCMFIVLASGREFK